MVVQLIIIYNLIIKYKARRSSMNIYSQEFILYIFVVLLIITFISRIINIMKTKYRLSQIHNPHVAQSTYQTKLKLILTSLVDLSAIALLIYAITYLYDSHWLTMPEFISNICYGLLMVIILETFTVFMKLSSLVKF